MGPCTIRDISEADPYLGDGESSVAALCPTVDNSRPTTGALLIRERDQSTRHPPLRHRHRKQPLARE
jgi:hypothetical protein